jgi:2-dehydro-3-deoxy-D-gluconate 5-dehydrogenase
MNIKNLFDISGKLAIITGASKGIGRAIAQGYYDAGAIVIGASRTPWDLPLTDHSMYIKTDMANPSEIENLVEEVLLKFGRIDILVNNAGIDEAHSSEETPLEVWDDILNVNLRGMFVLCREAGKVMLKQGSGKIINVSSILGLMGYPEALPYTTSKGGIIQMTRTLAVEWARYNINVNCIAPGFFKTEMVKAIMDDPGHWKFSNDKVPRLCVANPEEIIGTAIYLASEASSYVNGSVIVVDGGEVASGGYVDRIIEYYRQKRGN